MATPATPPSPAPNPEPVRRYSNREMSAGRAAFEAQATATGWGRESAADAWVRLSDRSRASWYAAAVAAVRDYSIDTGSD